MMAVSQLIHSVSQEFIVTSHRHLKYTKLLMRSDLSCGALSINSCWKTSVAFVMNTEFSVSLAMTSF